MESQLLHYFGNTVRRLRTERGFSQESFADACGLHRTYISDIELGKRNVSLENIERVSNALEISISQLFEEVEREYVGVRRI